MPRLYSDDRSGGPIPKFSDYHVWKTIMIIGKEGPIGRKTLSHALAIGEGSTRTILQNLMEDGFVEINRSGAFLTRKGKDIMRSSLIEVKAVNCGDLTIDEFDCAVRISNAAHRITTYGCEERDIAIRSGATGATTLIFRKDHLYFPGDTHPIDAEVENRLQNALRLRTGDVVIIGTGHDYELAERGAVTAALRLSGEMRKKKGITDILRSNEDGDDVFALAMTVHQLTGRPVCARGVDELGVRIEEGSVKERNYTGPLLEDALRRRSVIERVPTSGPYQGLRSRVAPLELDGRVLAVIGIVLDDEAV